MQEQYQLFQLLLINHLKKEIESNLSPIPAKGANKKPSPILRLIGQVLTDTKPSDAAELEQTIKLLNIYKDAADMHAAFEGSFKTNCPDGFIACTVDGNATCCPTQHSALIAQPIVEQPKTPAEMLNSTKILYWNCDISVYADTGQKNGERTKLVLPEVFLRPRTGLKVLDLRNVQNIKSIYFGKPYDVYIRV